MSVSGAAPEAAERISVAVYAADPVLHAGLVFFLRRQPELDVAGPDRKEQAMVALVVVDRLDEPAERLLRRLSDNATTRVGVIAGELEPGVLRTVVECGVGSILRRRDADQQRLLDMILAMACGEARLPGDLQGKLIAQVGVLHRTVLAPRGIGLAGLDSRETEVLRFLSEGLETTEIARRMGYSERTIKSILHGVIKRFRLRNRAQAISYAIRHGAI